MHLLTKHFVKSMARLLIRALLIVPWDLLCTFNCLIDSSRNLQRYLCIPKARFADQSPTTSSGYESYYATCWKLGTASTCCKRQFHSGQQDDLLPCVH